jgi:hypothetical protein
LLNTYVLEIEEGDNPVDLLSREVEYAILGDLKGSVDVLTEWVTVVTGNITEGFNLRGIFGSTEEAVAWAEVVISTDEAWWPASIHDVVRSHS